MMVEEGAPADEGSAAPTGAGEMRPDRRMREARAAETRSTGEMRTADAADMHAAEATPVHAAHAAAEMPAAAKAAAKTTAMASAAATMTAASASTATAGKHGRSECHHRYDRRRSETFEKPVVHRTILLAVRR
jgi:hypothetical protein